jgi:xylan 1,4-beta-xylosidase
VRAEFDAAELPIDFQGLRTPHAEDLFTLSARPGYLRLYGRETLGSVFRQSLVARRQQAQCYSAITAMEFEPAHFQQSAGIVCYYNSSKFHYLHVTHDADLGRHLRVMTCTPDSPQSDAFTAPVRIPPGRIELRVEVDYERLRFAWRTDGDWQFLPELFDASILSDEATVPGAPNFTGAFVGMACQDMAGTAQPADFDFYEYRERDYSRQV